MSDEIGFFKRESEWELTELKYLCDKVQRGRTPDYAEEETDYWIINQSCVREGSISFKEIKYNEEPTDNRGQLRGGDILLNSTGRGTVGRAAIFKGTPEGVKAFADSHVTILRPDDSHILPEFLNLIFQVGEFKNYIESVKSVGATNQLELNQGDLRILKIPAPDVKSQEKTVALLNRERKQVFELLQRCEEILESIDDWASANTTDKIVCGHSPYDDWKETDSDFFPRIPSDWENHRLKHLMDPQTPIVYGIILPGPDREEGVPIIKGGDCEESSLNPEKLDKTSYEKAAEYERSCLNSGDLVYEIRGSIGRVVKVPPELEGANLTQDTARISPKSDLNEDWLLYALRSEPFRQQMEQHARGATVRGINLDHLRNGHIPVPPRREQEKIVGEIQSSESNIKKIQADVQSVIRRSEEKMDALITKAITGQIDISDWQPPDEQEALA